MEAGSSKKIRLPKGLLYALLGFFILSAVPSSSGERTLTRTEQLVDARANKSSFSFAKFYSPVWSVSVFSKQAFLAGLFSYSCSVQVRLENRAEQVLKFTQIGINRLAYLLLRSDEEFSISNQG